MKISFMFLTLIAGISLANPPKPSHSGEAPWIMALPDNRDKEFELKQIDGDEVIVDTRFNWMWQNQVSENLDWYDAFQLCEKSQHAGFDDWELPSYWQIQSIVDHKREVDPYVFGIFDSIKSNHVLWSRDDSVGIDQPDHDDRWTFHARLGLTTWETRNQLFRSSCVRGKIPAIESKSGAGRFVEESPDLIKDLRTGLYWNSPRNTSVSKFFMWTVEMPWGQAYQYCENLNFEGKNNWRLPSVEELKMILALDRRTPSSWMPKMPASMRWLWSSDLGRQGNAAWAIQTNGQQNLEQIVTRAVFGCVHDK